MAPTITWLDRGPYRPPGSRYKFGYGYITLSATSTHAASGIEKQFDDCLNVQVQIQSGVLVNYKRSTTKNNGLLRVFASPAYTQASATTTLAEAAFAQQSMGIVSGMFEATGL